MKCSTVPFPFLIGGGHSAGGGRLPGTRWLRVPASKDVLVFKSALEAEDYLLVVPEKTDSSDGIDR
jgi:hypothetical protein